MNSIYTSEISSTFQLNELEFNIFFCCALLGMFFEKRALTGPTIVRSRFVISGKSISSRGACPEP